MKLEYYPWSEEILRTAIKVFCNSGLPCLDLEFGAGCTLKLNTLGCIYCDSSEFVGMPNPKELRIEDMLSLIDQGIELGLMWVYVCGLGEPKDDPKARQVINCASQKNVNISLFSNGINYSDEDIEFFHRNRTNLIIKCDSLDPRVFNTLLGGNEAKKLRIAESIYETIRKLIDVGYSQDPREPDLALSIVLTKLNIESAPRVLEFCKKWNLFPLIGELENAGKASKIYNRLVPTANQLRALNNIAKKILGYEYEIPICPAAFAGIHINSVGECIVHKQSGSSCPWFSLLEPDTISLGNVRSFTLRELRMKLVDYRKNLKESSDLTTWIETTWSKKRLEHIFGGCGGLKLMDLWIGNKRGG